MVQQMGERSNNTPSDRDDKVDALANAMQLLCKQVSELSASKKNEMHSREIPQHFEVMTPRDPVGTM